MFITLVICISSLDDDVIVVYKTLFLSSTAFQTSHMMKQKTSFNYRERGLIDFPAFLYTNVASDAIVVSMRCYRRKMFQ